MKFKYLIIFLVFVLFYGCSNSSNDAEFMKKTSGKYLYNSDEVIQIYFEENDMYIEWRGAKKLNL